LLSAHRIGGTVDALFDIGGMTVADAELILRGLPPQMSRRADPSIAARMRSKPVSVNREWRRWRSTDRTRRCDRHSYEGREDS